MSNSVSNTVSFRFSKEKDQKSRILKRQELIRKLKGNGDGFSNDFENLFSYSFDQETVGQKNCENLIGSVEIPVGVAGPVIVANDQELLIPLATTEGALVASVARGCKVINQSGGVTTHVKRIGMTRAPVFALENGQQAIAFQEWIQTNFGKIQQVTQTTSNHLKLQTHQSWVRGKNVFVRFVFDTDQAMGMNMVTIALQQAWKEVISNFSDSVEMVSISSNVCTDKKDSVVNRVFGRGFWAQAEIVLPESVIEKKLGIKVEALLRAHQLKNLVGSNVAGSFSQNMHVANMVAAVYLATGQDMAHVVEGSQASTTLEKVAGGVYFAVTMPNLAVGVVGGGTWLAAQRQARQLIRKDGKLGSEQLAEVVSVASLAGEISGLAALATQTLAAAHARLGREQKS